MVGIPQLELWRKAAVGDGPRVEAVTCGALPAILKRQRPARPQTFAGALRLLSGVTGLPLDSAAVSGGPQAQATELRRLRELRAAGVKVPQVLHEDPGFFVMELLPGNNLACELADHPADVAAWQAGLDFIRHAHARGQYFSQCFARNLIASPGGVAAIDFEDDPLQLMPLHSAQARDWLMYLCSTIWLLRPKHDQLLPDWNRIVEAEDGAVIDILRRSARRLGWLRHLPRDRRPWGRDVVSLQGAASFLHAWSR